ncbi:uncharacterized protein VTP21DRAFT_8313 [Calcarisporiella thermophila]|uniref:uncharacterized protein n=1 Tax=Calcarisporiella thermophila TaxID=911321 RepID=UPI003742EEFA
MSRYPCFKSQEEAGRMLSRMLSYYKNRESTAVLCLNRNALTLAATIAAELNLPLNLLLLHPFSTVVNGSSFTVGAIGRVIGGALGESSVLAREEVVTLKEEIIKGIGLTPDQLHAHIEQGRVKLRELYASYHAHVAPSASPLAPSKTLLLVDNGVRSGQTVRAAFSLIRNAGWQGRMILAAPVVCADYRAALREVDVVALVRPSAINVGTEEKWYTIPSEPSPVKLSR